MTQARELPRSTYYGIQDKAHELFQAIHDAMDAVQREAPEIQTDEWSDLHALSKLAGACSDLAHGFALEAEHAKPADTLTDQTAPYWPAEFMSCRCDPSMGAHEDDCGWAAAR